MKKAYDIAKETLKDFTDFPTINKIVEIAEEYASQFSNDLILCPKCGCNKLLYQGNDLFKCLNVECDSAEPTRTTTKEQSIIANVSVAVCDCCNGTGTVPVVNGFMFKDCPKCTHTER